LMKEIEKTFRHDIGSLQMVVNSIKEKRPLNALDVFSRYDSLYGNRQASTYQGVELTYEGSVGLDWLTTESVMTHNLDVIDDLGQYRSFKIVHGVIFPIGKANFGYKGLKVIKDAVIDAETK